MDKPHYDAILVVEGVSDKAFLLSFLDAEIVITNGSEVLPSTMEYLQKASKMREIVVLTDPDSPGKRIRDILDQKIPGLKHAFVRKEKSIKHHKVGVAESSKDEVMLALSHLLPSPKTKKGCLALSDLYDLGLTGSPEAAKRREKLEESLHLGYGNAKTLLERANALGLTKKDLQEALHD